MSNTIEGRTPVSIIADQVLKDLINGTRKYTRPKSKIENIVALDAQKKSRTNFRACILLLAFCVVVIYCGIEYCKNKVTGFAVDAKSGLLMFDSTVVFHNMENEKQYACKTNKRGNFNIRLPSGNYKFWVKDHGSLETARVQVSVEGESNYRITSFKK